ncbi:energy-coupling factor ABC transporter permease [Pontibacterium sp.]|uniref:energy-coupling factor ABC transporter permease n=1 Tax=Pontibacterium sp. TaxID=2036026 RepID=UPI003566F4E7
MSISVGLLSGYWFWLSLLIYLPVLGFAMYRVPWGVLKSNRRLQHFFLGAMVFLMVMWSMRAGISPGLGIHFLGVTALTLIFGWDLAIVAGTFALLGMILVGREGWDSLPINAVCSVLLPVMVTMLVLKVVEAKLTKNFFVYLFLCGFFGAGIAAASSGLAMGLLLWLDDVYSWSKINHEYVRYLPLIMFPEGLVNGIIITGMLVFHPDWVRTFDAKIYIDDQ